MSSSDFISLFSNRGKTILLAVLIPIVVVLGNAAWKSVSPSEILTPVAKQIQGLDSSVSSLEARVVRLENSSVTLDTRFGNIERFLCYQDKATAVLAGIMCSELVPNRTP